jgi:hypothetical protein
MKAIKTALRGTINDIGKAEERLIADIIRD